MKKLDTILKEKRSLRDITSEIISVIVGSCLYGTAIAMFLSPSETVLGGATGVATTLNILYGFHIGVVMFIVNLPIILFAWRVFGIRAIYKTIITVAITSLTTEIFVFLPVTLTDPLLCAVFGGLLLGVGGGILMSRGYSSGGSDLVALMLKKVFKRMSTGRLIIVIDLFIIVGSAFLRKNFAGIFYSVISTYAYSFALDFVLDGHKKARMALVISDKYKEIADAIFAELDRGVTVLHGLGWYSGNEKNVIMCVVKREELFEVKSLVYRIDPKSFMILTDAKEVLGDGFNALD